MDDFVVVAQEAALAAALAEHPPATATATATAPGNTDLPMPALLAGAIAGTHRAALREIQRRIMSGEPPARVRDTVAPAALLAFDRLCLGLHADAADQTSYDST